MMQKMEKVRRGFVPRVDSKGKAVIFVARDDMSTLRFRLYLLRCYC